MFISSLMTCDTLMKEVVDYEIKQIYQKALHPTFLGPIYIFYGDSFAT
jgi:hypothetical protein